MRRSLVGLAQQAETEFCLREASGLNMEGVGMRIIPALKCAVAAFVLTLLNFGPAPAAVFQLQFAGTVNSTLPGTSVDAGDPFFASFLFNTQAPQFIAGAFTESTQAITNISSSIDNAGNMLGGSTSTLNGSGDLVIEVVFSKFGAPFNGVGNFGRLSFRFDDVLVNNDFSAVTLASLAGAVFSGIVEAQAASSSDLTFTTKSMSVSAVPLPATLPLFASGLAGLGWLSRRRRRQLPASAPHLVAQLMQPQFYHGEVMRITASGLGRKVA